MQAAIWAGTEQIALHTVPDPTPEPGGLVIRVRACSICGTDLRIFTHGDPKVSPPFIIGHEIAGEVVALGTGTTGFQVGDQVVVAPPGTSCQECHYCKKGQNNLCLTRKIVGYHYPGGFAEYVAMPAAAVQQGLVLAIPAGLSYEEACITEPFGCVINGQEFLNIGPGDTVVVIGGGAIGLLHAQLARLSGAGQVIVSEVSARRAELARLLVDHVIDAGSTDPVQAVKELTHGLGADVAIVAASAPAAAEAALNMLGKRGRLSLFAGMPKSKPHLTIDANKVHYGEIAIFGASASTPRNARRALDLIASRQINARAVTTHYLPLSEIVTGFEMARSAAGLKVVIQP